MKVTLISATEDALHLLLFTKATRLNMTGDLMQEIWGWAEEKKAAEIAYMAKTIRSSWEFVDLCFLIEGVSRPCAQQITRTRTGSYAMQSQRVVDVSKAAVYNPYDAETEPEKCNDFVYFARQGLQNYSAMVKGGHELQVARGVLPQNITCNLVAKYNLRNFVDLVGARASLRVQGEYHDVAAELKRLAIECWPWSEPFYENRHDAAITMLEELCAQVGIEPGKGVGWEIAKAIDLLRGDHG